MSTFFGNLLKAALGVGALYIAYKVGEETAKGKDSVVEKIKSDVDNEIKYIAGLINECKDKKNKTKKDRDNLELLEIKMRQLRDN